MWMRMCVCCMCEGVHVREVRFIIIISIQHSNFAKIIVNKADEWWWTTYGKLAAAKRDWTINGTYSSKSLISNFKRFQLKWFTNFTVEWWRHLNSISIPATQMRSVFSYESLVVYTCIAWCVCITEKRFSISTAAFLFGPDSFSSILSFSAVGLRGRNR